MITKDEFLKDFGGHGNSYASYLILNTTANDVIRVLNEIDPDMCVGSGIEHTDGSVSFEICKELPNLVYDITHKLHTIGYADIDWNVTYTVAAKDGSDFDDYYAEETYGSFCLNDDNYDEDDEEALWDAFVTITDKSTGVQFYTGAGAVDREIMEYYQEMIDKHRKKKSQPKL